MCNSNIRNNFLTIIHQENIIFLIYLLNINYFEMNSIMIC